MLKLNIQLFGGRGATSGGGSSIDGVQVVKSTSGYKFWNIGRNAPKGYIGLIQGSGNNSKTAYIKTPYADEIANLKGDGARAMNYETIKVLDAQIKKTETALDKVKQERWQTASDIRVRRTRLENRLEQMRRVREIRQKLGL